MWEKQKQVDKLLPNQIRKNIEFDKAGWKLCKGHKYGMWSPKKPTRWKLTKIKLEKFSEILENEGRDAAIDYLTK